MKSISRILSYVGIWVCSEKGALFMHKKLIDEMSIADYHAMAKSDMYDWSPKKIEEWIHTSGGIMGQDEAVKAAAMILYNHYEGRPSVSLFIGPTGSGKTEIWRTLQREYGSQNIAIVDASTLTAEGWKGNNKLSTVFRSMESDARRNRLILVLDEADKIIEPVFGGYGTNHSEIVQNQLLRMCDHDTLFFGCDDGSGSGKPLSVDCSNVSVVMLGAFSKLYDKKTNDRKRLGFDNGQSKSTIQSIPEITIDDLIAFGMRRELAGRINRIVSLNPLTIKDMARIGQAECERLSTVLERPVKISPDALLMIGRMAQRQGLGARWVKSRIGQIIDEMIYEKPTAPEYVFEYEPPDADARRQAECRALQQKTQSEEDNESVM